MLHAVTCGIVFVAKHYPLPVDPSMVQGVSTHYEVIVVAAVVVSFGSDAVDIDHMVRRRRVPQRSPLATLARWQS